MQWGNIESIAGVHTVKGVLVKYYMKDLRPYDQHRDTPYKGPTSSELTKIEGHDLVLRVPYERLDVRRGTQVRVCFYDAQQELLTPGRGTQTGSLDLR